MIGYRILDYMLYISYVVGEIASVVYIFGMYFAQYGVHPYQIREIFPQMSKHPSDYVYNR